MSEIRKLRLKELIEMEQILDDYDEQTRHIIEDIRRDKIDTPIYWLKEILIELVKVNRRADRPTFEEHLYDDIKQDK